MNVIIHLLVFVVIAGLSHIISVFALPRLAKDDVFSRLGHDLPIHAMTVLDPQLSKTLPFFDPSISVAVCRYDLSDGPVRLRARLSDSFLAIVLADFGRGVYSSVSDRAATGGSLDVVIATQTQLDKIAALEAKEDAIEEIRIASPRPLGLAILKVVVDLPSARETAETVLREARCDAESLPN